MPWLQLVLAATFLTCMFIITWREPKLRSTSVRQSTTVRQSTSVRRARRRRRGGSAFRAALTTLDTGQADLIVTPARDIAGWASANGYRVEPARDGTDRWEIRSRAPRP